MERETSDRRDFFRRIVGRCVDAAADLVEGQSDPSRPRVRPCLRPPGALPEEAFVETCYRCGNCVAACPAEAIVRLEGVSEETDGTPYIDPEQQPCKVCEGLRCMGVCPTGALVPTPLEQIRMGLAGVLGRDCLRSSGQDCRECLEICPRGEKALRLDEREAVQLIEEGCIGCGLCQWRCPTSPSAILVIPR